MDLISDFSDSFWNLLKQANNSPSELETVLTQKSEEVIRRFHEELEEAHALLWESESDSILRTNFHASDNTVDDIFGYVILQGKDFYDDILRNPERISEVVQCRSCLRGVVPTAFWKRFGKEIDSPESMEQSPRIDGVTTSLLISFVEELTFEEEQQQQDLIVDDLKSAGYEERLVSVGTQKPKTITFTFLIEDQEAFETACKKVVGQHLPNHTFRLQIHDRAN